MPIYKATYEIILGTERGSYGPDKEVRRFNCLTREEADKKAKIFLTAMDRKISSSRSGRKFTIQHWTLVSVEQIYKRQRVPEIKIAQ